MPDTKGPPDRKNDGTFARGTSGNPAGRPRKARSDHADDATRHGPTGQEKNDLDGKPISERSDAADVELLRLLRQDGWNSLINGLGRSDYDKRMSVTFGCVQPVTDAMARDLWRGNHLAKKIIEKLPKHETRAGFELKIDDDDSVEADGEGDEGGDEDVKPRASRADAPEKPPAQPLPMRLDPAVKAAKELGAERRAERAKAGEQASDRVKAVTELWKKLDVVNKIRQARYYQRAYGGAAIILGAVDNGTPDQPLNLERVREFAFLTVLEPREIQPLYYYTDPMSPKFGEVEIWQVTPYQPGASSPRTLRSLGRPQTTLIHESRLIIFRGTTVSRITVGGVTPGFGDSALTPVHDVLRDYGIGWSAAAILLSDFSQAVYKMKGLAALLTADNADDFVERMRNMERGRSVARVTFIDKDDEFERKATPITGLSDLLKEFRVDVAAAAEMPVPELFGDTAGGGLSDTGEGWRKSWNAEIATSRDEHVIPAMTRVTEIALAATGGVPDTWCVEGKPIEQMDAKEEAEIEKLQAEADSIRIGDGVVSAEEVAVSRFADGKGSLRIDFDARENLEAAAPKPVETEGKDPDLEPPPMPMGPDGLPLQPKPPAGAKPPPKAKP